MHNENIQNTNEPACAHKHEEEFVFPDELPPVLTVDELARFLRVRRNAIYAMCARREIPGVFKIGRSIRFMTKVVLQHFESGDRRTKACRH